MNEVRRQASLSALGIQSWYARRSLAGAASSPAFEWASAADDTHSPAPLQAPPHAAPPRHATPEPAKATRTPRPSLAAVRASLEEEAAASASLDKTPQPEKNRHKAPVATAPDKTAAPAAMPEAPAGAPAETAPVAAAGDEEAHTQSAPASHELRLEGTLLSGQSLNLALDISQELSEEVQLKLAANILRALGDEPAGQPQPLCWPVFANAAVPGNDDQGLMRVAAALLRGQPSRPWLVLGPQMQALFQGLKAQEPARFTLWLANEASLQTLAANPASKRQLWQLLQAQVLATPLDPGRA